MGSEGFCLCKNEEKEEIDSPLVRNNLNKKYIFL
jgi:hypothetical protein